MEPQRLIVAIGRIERVLSRLEKLPLVPGSDSDAALQDRHEKLKTETKMAIVDIDRILAGGA